MEVSYKDSWDRIQEEYQAGEYGSPAHLRAEAALKIKSAIETAKNTKRLVAATWILAVFTIVLATSTIIYTVVTYKSYKGSERQMEVLEKQIEELKNLAGAIREIPITQDKLKTFKETRERLDEEVRKSSPQQRALGGRP